MAADSQLPSVVSHHHQITYQTHIPDYWVPVGLYLNRNGIEWTTWVSGHLDFFFILLDSTMEHKQKVTGREKATGLGKSLE